VETDPSTRGGLRSLSAGKGLKRRGVVINFAGAAQQVQNRIERTSNEQNRRLPPPHDFPWSLRALAASPKRRYVPGGVHNVGRNMEWRRVGASFDSDVRPIGRLRRRPMIVCSCNVLNDRDIQATIVGSAQRPRMSQVYASLGCSAKCGRCTPAVKRMLDKARTSLPEPDADQVACASLMQADVVGTTTDVPPRSNRWFAGNPDLRRQDLPKELPCSSHVCNCLAANSEYGNSGRPSALPAGPPVQSRKD
jgi:bacterioferritin-associated ferredoxin